MTIKHLVLSTGYVESQSLATMLVSHRTGFKTAEDAVVGFSAALQMYLQHERQEMTRYNITRACCKKSLETDPSVVYCAKCGNRLQTETDICHDDLLDQFEKMMNMDLDSFGHGWEFFDRLGWSVPSFQWQAGSEMAVVTDFRPVISGLEDDNGRVCNNEIDGKTFNPKNISTDFVLVGDGDDEDDFEEDDIEKEVEGSPELFAKYIFCLGKTFDLNCWVATITSKEYFDENGSVDDQHLRFDIPGWGCEMEGAYTANSLTDPQAMYDDLIAQGFKWSIDLQNWMVSCGGSDYKPFVPVNFQRPVVTGVEKVVAQLAGKFMIGKVTCQNIPTLPTGKFGTEECKKFITELITLNPGNIGPMFGNPTAPLCLGIASHTPKNWKRQSKAKEGKLNERLFSCEIPQGVLVAYVYDDGNQMVHVRIAAE